MVSISAGGNDWFGIGAAIGQSAAAKAVDGCGIRPLFGKKGKEDFDQCRKQAIAVEQTFADAAVREASKTNTEDPPNNTMYIVGGAILLIVLVLIFKK